MRVLRKGCHDIAGIWLHSSRDAGEYRCGQGWGDGDLYRMEMVDTLRIPSHLPPGDYVRAPSPPLPSSSSVQLCPLASQAG